MKTFCEMCKKSIQAMLKNLMNLSFSDGVA